MCSRSCQSLDYSNKSPVDARAGSWPDVRFVMGGGRASVSECHLNSPWQWLTSLIYSNATGATKIVGPRCQDRSRNCFK